MIIIINKVEVFTHERTFMSRQSIHLTVAALVAASLTLAGCAGAPAAPEAVDSSSSGPVEVDSPQPRIAVLHDEQVLVLDAETLETIADIPTPGATRVAAAGDGRHVMLTTESGFSMLDGGAWTDGHGDHGHSYTAEPTLTDASFPMSHPGHVVAHAGTTALFSDDDGTVTLVDTDSLDELAPEVSEVALAAPHHGVAVPLDDGGLVVTEGTAEGRTSIIQLDEAGTEVARTDACPGVHGESFAAGDQLLFGCTEAVVVFRDGEFRTIPLPDAGSSAGDVKGSEESTVVLTDYAIGDEAEPERIALIDVATDEVTIVDLPTGYYYWSLARGPDGEALVLGTDGSLYVLDPSTGEITGSVAVVDAWQAPEDWRDPAPSLIVLGHTAYVTDPASSRVHAIDLDTLDVTSVDLDVVPHSASVIRG